MKWTTARTAERRWTRWKMRDRLIEILEDDYDFSDFTGQVDYEALADHLLKNGVIVPLCKVGDTVYALENVFDDGKDCSTAYIAAYELFEITYDGENLSFSGGSYTFGENVFTTKEEAEAKLKELEE